MPPFSVTIRRGLLPSAAAGASCVVWMVFCCLAVGRPSPLYIFAAAVGVVISHKLLHLWASRMIEAGRGCPRADAGRAAALIFVSTAILLFYLPTYLFGTRPPLSQSILLACLAAAGCVITALVLARDSILRRLDGHSVRITACTAILITVLMAGLAVWKYYTFNYYGQVLAVINQTLWGTANGDFSFTSIYEFKYLYSHASWLLLGLVPFYKIWPSPVVYLLAKSVFIGLCAIPLYKIGRLYLRPALAATVTLLFLLYPGIISQHVIEENRAFSAFFILFMLYFFLRGRYAWFMIFLVLTMATKLSIIPALCVLPLYVLVRRPTGIAGDERRRNLLKWAAVPMLVIVAYAVLMYVYVVPLGQSGDEYVFLKRYEHFGNTPSEIITGLITHPGEALRMLAHRENLLYYYLLLLPFGLVVVFRSWEWLFAVPVLLVNMLQDLYYPAEIADHYTAEVAPFLVVAFVIGLHKIMRRARRPVEGEKINLKPAFAAACSLLLVLVTAGTFQYWLDARDYTSRPYYGAQREALARVPKHAAVQAPWYMLPALADRRGLYMPNVGVNWLVSPNVEYAIVDTHYDQLTRHQQEILPVVLEHLQRGEEGFVPEFERDGIFLFRRRKNRMEPNNTTRPGE